MMTNLYCSCSYNLLRVRYEPKARKNCKEQEAKKFQKEKKKKKPGRNSLRGSISRSTVQYDDVQMVTSLVDSDCWESENLWVQYLEHMERVEILSKDTNICFKVVAACMICNTEISFQVNFKDNGLIKNYGSSIQCSLNRHKESRRQ